MVSENSAFQCLGMVVSAAGASDLRNTSWGRWETWPHQLGENGVCPANQLRDNQVSKAKEGLSARCWLLELGTSVCISSKPTTGQEHQAGSGAVIVFGRTRELEMAVRQPSVCW